MLHTLLNVSTKMVLHLFRRHDSRKFQLLAPQKCNQRRFPVITLVITPLCQFHPLSAKKQRSRFSIPFLQAGEFYHGDLSAPFRLSIIVASFPHGDNGRSRRKPSDCGPAKSYSDGRQANVSRETKARAKVYPAPKSNTVLIPIWVEKCWI
jgi:hypothetical protein